MTKKSLLLMLSLVLALTIGLGSTLAYLTDSDTKTNVFTMGNVDIELNEDYNQNSTLMPDVEINKDAWITNKGNNPAYVWMTVAVPAEADPAIDLNWAEGVTPEDPVDAKDADGNDYKVYLVKVDKDLFEGEYAPLQPGEETPVLLDSVTMKSNVDVQDGQYVLVENGVATPIDYDLSRVDIPVSAFAIQSEGFDSFEEAYEAYGTQWGEFVVEKADPIVVNSSDELNALLDEIANNEENWNQDVEIILASGEYDGDIVINQYPEWNGVVGAGSSSNNLASLNGSENVTHITFVGGEDVVFTGNVTVNGFGNAQTGFANAKASTTFKNVTFDGTNSADNAEDSIVVYLQAGANDVNFEGCTFQNATHITTGGSGSNGVGIVTFNNCQFDNGGCISGYAVDVVVTNSTVSEADNGFISKNTAGSILVESSTINTGRYFLRTAKNGSGVNMVVNNCDISVYESEGEQYLVNYRGNTTNSSAVFNGCTFGGDYASAGVDADSTLTK